MFDCDILLCHYSLKKNVPHGESSYNLSYSFYMPKQIFYGRLNTGNCICFSSNMYLPTKKGNYNYTPVCTFRNYKYIFPKKFIFRT